MESHPIRLCTVCTARLTNLYCTPCMYTNYNPLVYVLVCAWALHAIGTVTIGTLASKAFTLLVLHICHMYLRAYMCICVYRRLFLFNNTVSVVRKSTYYGMWKLSIMCILCYKTFNNFYLSGNFRFKLYSRYIINYDH